MSQPAAEQVSTTPGSPRHIRANPIRAVRHSSECGVNLFHAAVGTDNDFHHGSPLVDRSDPPDQRDQQGWSPFWSLDAAAEPKRVLETAREQSRIRHVPHLRSFREIRTYVATHDGEQIAQVEVFVIDTLDWSVRFMVAGLGRWRTRGTVAVPTNAIAKISWFDRDSP